jgi:hypothetical protein
VRSWVVLGDAAQLCDREAVLRAWSTRASSGGLAASGGLVQAKSPSQVSASKCVLAQRSVSPRATARRQAGACAARSRARTPRALGPSGGLLTLRRSTASCDTSLWSG